MARVVDADGDGARAGHARGRDRGAGRRDPRRRPPRRAGLTRRRSPADRVASASAPRGIAGTTWRTTDARRPRVDRCPTCSACSGWPACRVFLWLVLGPEADGWALALLMVSGVTDFLDGYLARRLDQTSPLGQILDPVADRLYILAVVVGLGAARHHPVVGGADPAAARPAAVGPGAVPAHPRLQRAAGPLPRQGRDLQPALRVPAAAARRRRGHARRPWPTCSAGRSPSGGSGCTGGPASSTPGRSHRLLADDRRDGRRPPMAETAEPDRCPTARHDAAADADHRSSRSTRTTGTSPSAAPRAAAAARAAGAQPVVGRRR